MFDIDELLDNLQVEQLDRFLFRGDSLPLPFPKIFGGQVLAQALNAAERTVAEDRHAHSMHAYFLRPGNAERPVIFDVDPIRDGGSFATRRVVAKQDGKAIFNCAISFHRAEEGPEHQVEMPAGIRMPETLERNIERIEQLLQVNRSHPLLFEFPLEAVDIRAEDQADPFDPGQQEPVNGFWFRFIGRLPDEPALHRMLLTYISDKELMLTGLRPHGLNMLTPGIQLASLDHALWFHADFRVDEWLYYHMESPRSAHGRYFGRGSFYSRDGVLVASSAQEGLARLSGR
ncbi:acyl-CoA thioesterase II [Marinobacterium nitratireducens]|uniref:Acyl-CoA thioesterase 2 n=1 Tax=Marinobacterium nitratireducens TaxID=518897 RepID=A0A917ZDX5_9GAMM|nr:acyl-CoA thioesterase II [Marinobacterium nitratireducens]GGO81663.1 acyl-CoA thioesterase II [Marinobacterium nitratireducens]